MAGDRDQTRCLTEMAPSRMGRGLPQLQPLLATPMAEEAMAAAGQPTVVGGAARPTVVGEAVQPTAVGGAVQPTVPWGLVKGKATATAMVTDPRCV